MDPLTHTLAGAALARSRLGRKVSSGVAAATLVVGANLPDVDAVCYLVGSDFALAHRRGWTHGVLAMAVLPVALALLVAGTARLGARDRTRPPGSAPPFRQLLFLSAVGVWSHPLLDWLNTYGVRFLAPFDWTWFYGDAVFIVEPWLWLLLGGGVFLGASRSVPAVVAWAALAVAASWLFFGAAPAAARIIWIAALALLALARWRLRTSAPRTGAERAAAVALAATGVYVAALVGSSAAGRVLVRRALADAEPATTIGDVMVGPVAADPFRRDVVVRTGDGFRVGTLHWLEGGRIELQPETLPGPEPADLPPPIAPFVRSALDDPSIHGFVTWMRYPSWSAEAVAPGAVRVDAVDLRYARGPGRGFGTTSVVVGQSP